MAASRTSGADKGVEKGEQDPGNGEQLCDTGCVEKCAKGIKKYVGDGGEDGNEERKDGDDCPDVACAFFLRRGSESHEHVLGKVGD